MKKIKMSDLKKYDIFTKELKLYNREAYVVTEVKEKTIECISRKTEKSVTKIKVGYCFLLRTTTTEELNLDGQGNGVVNF